MATMGKKNKRKQAEEQQSSETKKQKSIVTFFDVPIPIEESTEEDIAPVKAETNDKELYFPTSMYTDEVDNMISTILEGEVHLLNQDELLLLTLYNSLSDEPKHLIVRLLMRKHGWIRKQSMDYSKNIRNLDAAINALQESDFIDANVDDLSEALNILSADDIKDLLRKRNIPITDGKPQHIRRLLEFSTTSTAGLVTNDAVVNAKRKEKLWTDIRNKLGQCVKVKDSFYQLFNRLQIIYYRINILQNTKAMTNSILAKSSKRHYPAYTPSRTNIIWSSREDLLAYERALMIEDEFHKKLEHLGASDKYGKKKSEDVEKEEIRQGMIDAWTLCENCIGLWEDELAIHGSQERPYYLRRFEAGWVYTRLLDHGLDLLGKLREYELEEIMLKKLLKQNLYRLSKRGKWYERLILIQMHHVRKDKGRAQKKVTLNTCLEAVRDPKVHQIFLHCIHNRIRLLEKGLFIPKREQHDFSYMGRKEFKEIKIYGERLSAEDIAGKKTIWRSDDGSECTVEQVAIEYYKKQGYKGLHCENGIVRMIVVLLFWDILLAPIPGVFETPYQTEPFDLRTDSFYESRVDMIQSRLKEIESGKHLELIQTVDQRERPLQTRFMGINWSYEYQDIMEIAECIGASSLASLCKIYLQEFGQRQGGLPDLCCWDYEKKICLFSEVKGPNDKLSKTQREWIEALSDFGIPVEVCHVEVWKGEDMFLNQ